MEVLFLTCSMPMSCRDVAAAIVTHPWKDTKKWKETMRVYLKEDDKIITPMRMLIEQMPGRNKKSVIRKGNNGFAGKQKKQ